MVVEKGNATDSLSKKSRLRKQILISLTLFFLFVGFLFLLYWLFFGRYYESTEDAYVDGNLVRVMPEISGHVTGILAEETDYVNKGDPLVVLDKADAYLNLKRAESELALVVRKVSKLYKNIDQLKSTVVEKQADLEKAKSDLQRRQSLIVNKQISIEDLQHAKIAVDNTTAALATANNQVAAAITLVSNSDLYHHPQVVQAADALRNAYLTWFRTTIAAPDSGYIAKRYVQVGQQVDRNTVLMIIVPLDQLWVDANFKESQLQNIRIGQPAVITADAYGSEVKYKGTVAGLSPGTGSAFELLPPQNATGNWIKVVQRLPVRISIDPKQLAEYPLRIGLSTKVTVDTHNRKGRKLTEISKKQIIYQTKDQMKELTGVDKLIDSIMRSNAENISYPARNAE